MIRFLLLPLLLVPSLLSAAPNIIFVMADDMGYGDVGALWQNTLGAKSHQTPYLDQMIAEGMILERHYTPAPVCAPCRGSLLTGLHQGHARINDTDFDEALADNHTLGTVMKAAGYKTACIGKWGIQGGGGTAAAWPAYPTKRGFDFYHGYVRHGDGHQHYPGDSWPMGNSTAHRSPKEVWENNSEISGSLGKCFTPDLFTARAKAWIAAQTSAAPQEPFFLYLAYDTPHAALQLATQAYPNPLGLNGGVQWNGTGGGPAVNTATGTIDSYYHPDYVGKPWSDEEKRFASLMRRLDNNLGDLMQTLRDLDIHENTLIVFTSDNGPHDVHYIQGGSYNARAFKSFGPFEGIKRDCWEGGIRMPTIAWWPGTIPAGSSDATPSQMHDWMATFADLGEGVRPAFGDGVSLVPTLKGEAGQRESTVYIEFNHNGSSPNYAEWNHHRGESRNQQQVIYLEGYKGVRNNVGSHADSFEIYDTATDLVEGNDLAGSTAFFAGLQQRMKDRVLRLRNNAGTKTRPWSSENVPAVTVNTEQGINYQTFEGDWSYLPEFTHMAPLASDSAASIEPADHLSRAADAGLLYTGLIDVPAAGTWNFYLSSDAGAHLRIHDSHVVDDDFNHDGSESSGSINLAAGLHPFALYYRNEGAAPSLDLEWSGPGTAKSSVPNSALRSEGIPDPAPEARDDSSTTNGGQASLIDVLANDLDDGFPAPLSIASFTQAFAGTTSEVGGEILYTPDAGFLGTDTFSYTITDGQFTAAAQVTIDVIYDSSDLWIPLDECVPGAIREAGGAVLGSNAGALIVDGKHGRALAFDGADNEISIATDLLPTGVSPRTAMAWIRVEPGASAENQGIFAYGSNTPGGRFTFRLNGNSNQTLRLEVQQGSIIGTTPLDDGQWHHVAVVASSAVQSAALYVDGVRETVSSSVDRSMNTTAANPTLGGASHSGGFTFDGIIDDFRLFPTAMNVTQIQAQMDATQQAAAVWHRRYFGDAPIDWNADGDGDELGRLLEYALVTEPHIAGGSAPINLLKGNGELEISHSRRLTGSHDLIYELQISTDLSAWMPFVGGHETDPVNGCVEQIRYSLSPDPERQFARLLVSLVP